MNIALIISFIQLAIKAAPSVVEVYKQGRELIEHLFHTGLIDKATQDKLLGWANEHQRATLAGEVPPELTVEADPI